MDMNTRIVNALVDHVWFLIGIAGVIYFLFPRVLKAFFNNGGGDVIRAIVKSENLIQSEKHSKELNERLEKHERDEAERFRRLEDRVFGTGRRSR